MRQWAGGVLSTPLLETDHGVEVRHPRYASLGRLVSLPGMIPVQRRLYWRALEKSIAAFRADGGEVVHIHSCALPGVVLGRIAPAKLVVSMWDDELFDVVPASRRWRRVIAETLRNADSVVYITETLKSLAEDIVGPHAATVIPLGIDEYSDIHPSPAREFTVVTAARLIARKNIDVALRAFARLRAQVPSARMAVLGDGPERQTLTSLAERLGLAAAVDFSGAVSHRAVRESMARAHVFVLPSVREALGTVYFEAMSVGVPVIGVAGEGLADYITHGVDGFLVSPGDVDGLANIMRMLHADPDQRRRVGERGRALFHRSGMRWQDHVDAHIELFERLASSHAR
jgi:glycosyltransferase involved in cell wall biosynthesis